MDMMKNGMKYVEDLMIVVASILKPDIDIIIMILESLLQQFIHDDNRNIISLHWRQHLNINKYKDDNHPQHHTKNAQQILLEE